MLGVVMRKLIALIVSLLVSSAQAQVIGLPGLGSLGQRGLTTAQPQAGPPPVGGCDSLLLANGIDTLLLANGIDTLLLAPASCVTVNTLTLINGTDPLLLANGSNLCLASSTSC
jgi:hypothetical protein